MTILTFSSYQKELVDQKKVVEEKKKICARKQRRPLENSKISPTKKYTRSFMCSIQCINFLYKIYK